MPTEANNLTALESQPPDRCYTVESLARYWRVAPRRVRELIRSGILAVIDVGIASPRRRVRITPEAIRQAERMMTLQPGQPGRRPARDDGIDPEVAAMLEEAAAGGSR